jgi:hypothetical protein
MAFIEKKTEKENPLMLNMNIYPNPTIDYLLLTLDNESSEPLKVVISDVTMGRVFYDDVFEKTATSFSTKLDIRNLPDSNYIVKIIQGNEQVTKKISKIN